jgi:hypothetical protein
VRALFGRQLGIGRLRTLVALACELLELQFLSLRIRHRDGC